MPVNLRGRHLLSLRHHTADEIRYLLDLSRDLKRAKYAGTEQPLLQGRNVALIFEKTSTRTRCAFEVASYDQGAHVTYIDPASSQLGHKESVADTARVLGRMYDAIEYRGFSQEVVEELAKFAGVPVFNGLTDEFHPTQMLADVLTMREHSDKPIHEIAFAYVGDGRNNVANSLMLVAAKLGMDVRIGAPKDLWPEDELVKLCHELADESGARILVTDDPSEAVGRRLHLHRRVGVDGRARQDVGRARRGCLPFRSTPTCCTPPATRGSRCCTACRPSTTPRPRSGPRWSSSTRSSRTGSRSPRTCSSPRPTSPSTRRRTGCTPSRRSSWRRWPEGTRDEDRDRPGGQRPPAPW